MAALSGRYMEFHQVHGANVRIDSTGTQATRVESFANGVCFSRQPLLPGELFLVEIEEKELGWCGNLRVGLTGIDPRSMAVVPEYSLPDLVSLGDSWIFAITRNHNRAPPGEGEEEEGVTSRSKDFFTASHLQIGSMRIPMDKLVGRSRPGRFSHILDDLYKTNALPPTARRSRIGVLYVPRSPGTADMHIVINGEDMGPCSRGIPTHHPLYAVVDVFAATKSVRVIQLEYGFPSLQTLCRQIIQKHIVHRTAIAWLDLPRLLKHICMYE
ncbi:NEUL2 protein, partial [Polyodon spathula]|nr:neuralized-like protein 2 [Polyodon spathula]MBN3288532.1 NEUL2 protein [Polyodon spathula]